MLWILHSIFLREIAGAFEDASNAIRIEMELNGGEEITREAV